MMTASIALLALLAAAPPDGAAALRPCPASAEQPTGALCGQVSVPENRGVKGGRQIALSIVVLPSRSEAGKRDPVFGLAGGPGVGATRLAVSYPRLYDMLQNDHDIVLVDQRGTGASNPLFCSSSDISKTPQDALAEWPDDKTIAQCRDRLAKTADLRQYTTAAAVDDLDAVRQALGYGKINILAISYGTRTGVEYLRRYGSQVRAIVLSGVFPPGYRPGLDEPREAQQALDRLFAICAADTACNGAFPGLSAEFTAVMTALGKAPATATVPFNEGQPAATVVVSRKVFARELAQLLMLRDNISAVPLAIHSAADGDYMPFAGLAMMRQLNRNPQADGLALSVLCSTGAAAMTPAAMAAATRGTFMRDDRAQFLKRACTIWPKASDAASAATPIRAETPALLISGALDPVTPPSSAAGVAKGLPNSFQVVVANAGHVPANPCVHGLISTFLKSGSPKGLDAGCATAFPPLKFVTSMPKVQ